MKNLYLETGFGAQTDHMFVVDRKNSITFIRWVYRIVHQSLFRELSAFEMKGINF